MTKTYLTGMGAAVLLLGAGLSAPSFAQAGTPAPAPLIAGVRAASAHLGSIYQELISRQKNPAAAQRLDQQRATDLTALDSLVSDASGTTETHHENTYYRAAAAHLGTVYQERIALEKDPAKIQQLRTDRARDLTALRELIQREENASTGQTRPTLTLAQRKAAAEAATANQERLHPRPILTLDQRKAAAEAATAAQEKKKAAGH